MNHCHFSGRIVADADTRYTSSGTPVISFRIAVDTGYGDHKRTDFINCVLWKREQIGPHLTKGKPIMVSGEYQGREYEDRNGQKQRIVEIIVRDVEFQQGQPKQDSENQQGYANQRRQESSGEQPFPSANSMYDDVPF